MGCLVHHGRRSDFAVGGLATLLRQLASRPSGRAGRRGGRHGKLGSACHESIDTGEASALARR